MQHPSLLRAVWFLLLVGAMLLLGQLRPPVFASKPLAFIWPVSGMDSADLPHSSAYGPRLKASEDFRYDYHQGIDIPTPLNTPLLAVADGTVRIAGEHDAYSDGVVQLNHGNGVYSNYLHVNASLVELDQVVSAGDPVALSGESESGFDHLHFEIRDGSLFRRHAKNPWRYLPYVNSAEPTASITSISPDDVVWMQATTPANELDINSMTLTITDLVSAETLASYTLDYEARNLAHLGDPNILDTPLLDSIEIAPHAFNGSSDTYVVDVGFHDLPAMPAASLTACAEDIGGLSSCAASAIFQFPLVPGTP